MVRVVVVDDDKEELEHIKDLLDEVVKEEKEVVTFTRLTDRLKK